jgi:hypothetical protein
MTVITVLVLLAPLVLGLASVTLQEMSRYIYACVTSYNPCFATLILAETPLKEDDGSGAE